MNFRKIAGMGLALGMLSLPMSLKAQEADAIPAVNIGTESCIIQAKQMVQDLACCFADPNLETYDSNANQLVACKAYKWDKVSVNQCVKAQVKAINKANKSDSTDAMN